MYHCLKNRQRLVDYGQNGKAVAQGLLLQMAKRW
jgi:hypothetical protein